MAAVRTAPWFRKCRLVLSVMTSSSGKAGLQGIRLSQELLHARPTLARRLFWSAPAVPVSFKADGVVIAVAFQGPELPRPVNDPISHRRPIITFCAFDPVLAVAVAETLLGL